MTIFEARKKAGGLNEYGIAAYKTLDGFAQAEVDFIPAIGGITIENGKALGSDITLDDLRATMTRCSSAWGLAASMRSAPRTRMPTASRMRSTSLPTSARRRTWASFRSAAAWW